MAGSSRYALRPAMTKNKRRRAPGGVIPVQIVKQPSVSVLAARNPRELRILFSISLPGGSVSFAPQTREQSAVRRKESVPLQRARDRSCRTGLALRRSTAAFSILGAPLPFDPGLAFRLREGTRNEPEAPVLRREADPRTPGTAVSETAGAGAAPHSRSVRLGTPLGEWG